MKRFFILATAAIVALASCAKTEVVYKDGPQEIAFKQITGVMTKAEEPAVVSSLDGNEDMGVFANYASNNHDLYFANEKFVNKSTYWGGQTTQYWPLEGSLDFVFYAPYAERGVTGPYLKASPEAAAGPNQIEISVNNADKAQVNWLYSDRVYTGSKATTPMIAPVMKHLLAKVTVNVTGSPVVRLDEIILKDTEQTETATITYNNQGSVVSWSNTGAVVSKNLMATNDKTADALSGEPMTMTCYVIPSNQTSFDVVYSISNDGGTSYASAPTYNYSLSGATWAAGKHYVYNVSITPQEISFNPQVEPWGDSIETSPEIQ